MKKKILLVTDRPSFSKSLTLYALGLAQRLDCGVTALFVRAGHESPHAAPLPVPRRFSFAGRAMRSAAGMAKLFSGRGIAFEHELAGNSLTQAVEAYHHEAKRVEFAIVESRSGTSAPVLGASMPVHYFGKGPSFTGSGPALPGLFREIRNPRSIAMSHSASKSRHLVKAAAALAASAGMYAVLFANESTVTSLFTKGGLYAALPIAAAFAFSFVYGAFAHSFWAAMGIEPHHKTRVATRKAPAARKDVRPRPVLQA